VGINEKENRGQERREDKKRQEKKVFSRMINTDSYMCGTCF
jgi:hypothetical protein